MIILKLSKVGSKTVDEYELEDIQGTLPFIAKSLELVMGDSRLGAAFRYGTGEKVTIIPAQVLRNSVIELEEADETPVLQDLP